MVSMFLKSLTRWKYLHSVGIKREQSPKSFKNYKGREKNLQDVHAFEISSSKSYEWLEKQTRECSKCRAEKKRISIKTIRYKRLCV